MTRAMTFGQKIGLGYLAVFAFALVIGILAIVALRSVNNAKDRVLDGSSVAMVEASDLRYQVADKVVKARGYAISREDRLLKEMNEARASFKAILAKLKPLINDDPKGLELFDRVETLERTHQQSWDQAINEIKAGASQRRITTIFNELTRPKHLALEAALADFTRHEEEVLNAGRTESDAETARVSGWLLFLVAVSALAAGVLSWYLARVLSRQIGSAVQHVQSSASELQSSANEQATGSKEQASAVNEIATTIKELLSTSRQISESAQRVASIAEETVKSAQDGDRTVLQGQDAIAMIRRQTDQVVNQVLELGKRSQQIQAVVDIITELAEQTNILAINATIEAAGAGESGRRFSVVADEIRKLADRVGTSAKDIQGIIEEIRSSVNTSVMATESGSKAVEAGTRQFGDVARAFHEIASSVATVTQAAREIELSTKQQTTAVEQVNSAISDVAQAVHEMEANSTQTLQTSSQLAMLSRDLSGLVQTEKRAA